MLYQTEKIGIYAGTFDPVHLGHISFALQAQKQAGLDTVYFLPELKPRHKPNVSDIKHRLAMLEIAIKPYPNLELIKLNDNQLSFKNTVPQLQNKFGDSQLVYLFGSDVFRQVPNWSDATDLANSGEFVISIRSTDDIAEIVAIGVQLASKTTIIKSQHPEISSKLIRNSKRANQNTNFIPEEVIEYAIKNKLYH